MLSRRSLFSFLAGIGAAVTGAKAVEAKPVDVKWVPSTDPTPRYYSAGYVRGLLIHSEDPMLARIATGRGLETVLLDSNEGQAIVTEIAVNLRDDGSIRHRQHHPIDFPPKR